MSHVPSIDALALPANFPRVGDNLHKLYAAIPPSPYKPESTLQPMRVNAEDVRYFSSLHASSPRQGKTALPEIPVSPRQNVGGAPSSPQKWGQTTYRRFFDAPQVTKNLNDPQAYRLGKTRMERGSGDILGGFLHEAEVSHHASDGSSTVATSGRRARNERPQAPPTPLPPPPPPISYAERMVAQAAVEEARLAQRISERKKGDGASNSGRGTSSSPRRVGEGNSDSIPRLDAGSLKNLFLVPSNEWDSRPADDAITSARNKIRQQLQLASPRR